MMNFAKCFNRRVARVIMVKAPHTSLRSDGGRNIPGHSSQVKESSFALIFHSRPSFGYTVLAVSTSVSLCLLKLVVSIHAHHFVVESRRINFP